MEGLNLILLLCTGLFAFGNTFSQDSDAGALAECQYCYTEQPPEDLACNPYINSELRLECRIRVPFRSRPQVVWFYRTENDQQQGECRSEMLQNTETAAGQPKISIPPLQRMGSILEGQTHVRSRLHIRRLNDSDAGVYWCRLITNGSKLLEPSDPVYLQTQAAYVNFSASCPPLSSISKREEKCADSIRPTPNSSLTCYTSSTPQAITPSQTVRASLQGTRVQETITSSSMIVPSLRPTPVLHNSYISLSTTEMPSMAPVLPTDLEDGTYTPDTVTRTTSPTSNKLLPELCIAVAVLVLFGIAIAILFPITIYMCLKRPDTKGAANTKRDPTLGSSIENGSVILTAFDYLVPIPQPRLHTTNLEALSHDTALSISHEYEDIIEAERQDRIYVNPIRMNRNEAYRAFSVQCEMMDNPLQDTQEQT